MFVYGYNYTSVSKGVSCIIMDKVASNHTNEPDNILFIVGEMKSKMVQQGLNDEFYNMCECIFKAKNYEDAFDIIKIFYHIYLK